MGLEQRVQHNRKRHQLSIVLDLVQQLNVLGRFDIGRQLEHVTHLLAELDGRSKAQLKATELALDALLIRLYCLQFVNQSINQSIAQPINQCVRRCHSTGH
jgi:hypothetical protein